MPANKKEFERLILTEDYINSKFAHFGVNKRQELIRLFYEISKRENISPLEIIHEENIKNFEKFKKELLAKRFPQAIFWQKKIKPYLPKLKLPASDVLDLKEKKFSPKNIFVEKDAAGSFLAKRLKELFPQALFHEIETFRKYWQGRLRFQIKDYNHRQDQVFVVNERYDFFKACPCTTNAVNCGYQIFNLGFGCIFECNYCFLQEYTNTPGIILPANIDKFFDQFKSFKKPGMRLGTGEFSDSLALDDITQYSLLLIEFFNQQNGVQFEFKTKSIQVENLLKTKHCGNIIVSWSLNPQCLIDENEFFTPSLDERLAAAEKCVEAGYKVGFHFDPIIYFADWEKEYRLVIEKIFCKINPSAIAWVSLGTFRFKPELKMVIESRFPANKILDAELLLDYDRKLRYPFSLRKKIYQEIIGIFLKRAPKINLYLCMEESQMWKEEQF